MRSGIHYFQNLWDSTSGHPLEKASGLIQQYSKEDQQIELEAVNTVLAHRLSIVITQETFPKWINYSSMNTMDELFNTLIPECIGISEPFSNKLFRIVIDYFYKVETNDNRSTTGDPEIKLYLPFIEKIFTYLKEQKKIIFDTELALVDFIKDSIVMKRTLAKVY